MLTQQDAGYLDDLYDLCGLDDDLNDLYDLSDV